MKYYKWLMGLLMSIIQMTHAQDTVHGRITDADSNAVVAATIKSSNNATLAVSDSLGNFVLRRPLPQKMTVSHLSYQDYSLIVGEQETGPIIVVLEPMSQFIEEVNISTGIQQVPKERSTGAFSFIDNKKFGEQVSSDVVSRLEAVANGLSVNHMAPENELGVRIRGQSTFAGGTMRDPLIILDNFPFEGNLNNINPNDVENITLLKDAAAASIWGARAANGVIVITTKRAKQNQPLRIDFNSNATLAGKPDLMRYNLMSSKEFIDVERFLFTNNFRFSDTVAYNRPSFSPVYEILFRQRAGALSESEADRLIDAMARTDIRDEYLAYLYEPPLSQQYAINIRGGNERSAWYFSTGYDRSKSDLAAKSDRLTVNFRNMYSPVTGLQVHTGVMYVQNKQKSGRTGYSNGDMFPYTRFADENGGALPADHQLLRTYRQPYLDTLGGGGLLDWKYYPLTDDRHQTNKSMLDHILMNLNIQYRPAKWLDLDVKYQYGREQSDGEFFREEENYYVRNLINRFTQYDNSGNIGYRVPRGGIIDLSKSVLQSHNLRGQAMVSKKWSRHALNVLLGMELSHRNDRNDAFRTYGYDPEILTFNYVDYLTSYPLFIEKYNSFIPQNQYFNDRTHRFISTFFNGSYTFDGKYAVSISGRRDASNLFGVNVNDRWNLLWSSGASWEVSEESFFNADLVPYLRLRATYGFSGNTDLSRSAVTTVYYNGIARYVGVPQAYVSQDANPELRWEKVRMINFAIDFRFKNDRVSGSLDFFLKRGTDLLGPDPVDYTTGILNTITRNVAKLNGKGLDLQLSSKNVATDRWHWETTINLSYYDDKVVDYYLPNLNPSSYVSPILGYPLNIEGERMYAIYSHRWAGLDPESGSPQGYLDGAVSMDYSAMRGAGSTMNDLVNHGSSIPLVFGTLGNTISYKNLGLSFSLMFKLKYAIRTDAVYYYDLFQQGKPQYNEWNRRWQAHGDEQHTDVPSMVYPANGARDNLYRLSEIKVQPGDHLRLRYVNLYYDFVLPNSLRSRTSSARVYFNVANVGLLWKRGNYSHDPMYGFDKIAPSTTYSLGLKISI